MTFLNRRLLGVLFICAIVGALGAAAQSAQSPAKKWPPQFPREGATKLFENEKVIIWEQVGRPKEAFQHKHIHDIITIGLEPGGGITVLNADGARSTGSSLTQTVYNRRPNTVSYSKAGIGPHAEVMVDANNPGRSIFVEIKGTEPKDCRDWSTACQ